MGREVFFVCLITCMPCFSDMFCVCCCFKIIRKKFKKLTSEAKSGLFSN